MIVTNLEIYGMNEHLKGHRPTNERVISVFLCKSTAVKRNNRPNYVECSTLNGVYHRVFHVNGKNM